MREFNQPMLPIPENEKHHKKLPKTQKLTDKGYLPMVQPVGFTHSLRAKNSVLAQGWFFQLCFRSSRIAAILKQRV